MIFFCYHFSHNDDGLFPEIVSISLIYPFSQIQNHLDIQIGSIPLGFVRKNRNPLDIQRSNRLTPWISSWNIFGTPRITDIFHMGVWTIPGKQSRPKKSIHDRNEITKKKWKHYQEVLQKNSVQIKEAGRTVFNILHHMAFCFLTTTLTSKQECKTDMKNHLSLWVIIQIKVIYWILKGDLQIYKSHPSNIYKEVADDISRNNLLPICRDIYTKLLISWLKKIQQKKWKKLKFKATWI